MKLTSIFCIAIAAAALASSGMARTWTEAETGKKIEAEYVRFEDGKVILKMGGRLTQVPLDRLSEEDQAFVKGAVSGVSPNVTAGEWPRWRGADFSGISPDQDLLKEWPDGGPEQVWVYDKAGMGYAGYAIADGKLFTLGTRDEDLVVIAVNIATGKEIWSTKISDDDQKGYNAGWGHGPRSTPTCADIEWLSCTKVRSRPAWAKAWAL